MADPLPSEETGDHEPVGDRAAARDPSRAIGRQALAIAVAVGAYGLSFGALGVISGFSTTQVMVLSLFLYSGSSQFAFVGVAAQGGGIGAVATSGLLGLRNSLYGLRLNRMLDASTPVRKTVTAHFVSDESAAMALAHAETEPRRAFWRTGIVVYLLWNAGTLIGALATAILPDPQQLGLDMAASAAFLALCVPLLRDRAARPSFAVGIALCLLLTPVLANGLPILSAAVGAVVVAGIQARLERRPS